MSDEQRLDKASERLHSFLRGSAVESRTTLNDDLLLIESYVSLYHSQREMRATAESQNQALQEELTTTQEAYRFKRTEAERLGREGEALQERAEKAERERDEARLAWTAANERLAELTRIDLLSLTQETDPG